MCERKKCRNDLSDFCWMSVRCSFSEEIKTWLLFSFALLLCTKIFVWFVQIRRKKPYIRIAYGKCKRQIEENIIEECVKSEECEHDKPKKKREEILPMQMMIQCVYVHLWDSLVNGNKARICRNNIYVRVQWLPNPRNEFNPWKFPIQMIYILVNMKINFKCYDSWP